MWRVDYHGRAGGARITYAHRQGFVAALDILSSQHRAGRAGEQQVANTLIAAGIDDIPGAAHIH
jgi:hypothetical protein